MAVTINNEGIFFILLKQEGLPEPHKEYRFHPNRKWRFDYCYPDKKIAIEIEGGVFSQGRHVRSIGFLGDIDKYNEAVRRGWRLIRVIPTRLCNYEFIELIVDLYNDISRNYIKEEDECNKVRGKKSRAKKTLA